MRLKHRAAIITGAKAGIGFATASGFTRVGTKWKSKPAKPPATDRHGRQHEVMTMKLRPALAIDTESLFDIRCSVLENHQSREELATLGITTQRIMEMIETGDYVTTIAEEAGQAVGFSMAQISEGYVFACFVKPGFEGRGCGRALMEAAEKGLRRGGVQNAWLSTGSEPDLRATGFYLHLSWRKAGYLDDGQTIFKKTLMPAPEAC